MPRQVMAQLDNPMAVGAPQWPAQLGTQRAVPMHDEMVVQPPTMEQMLSKLMSKMLAGETGSAASLRPAPQPQHSQTPQARVQQRSLDFQPNHVPRADACPQVGMELPMTPRMSRFEQAEAMPQGYLVDSRHFTSDPSALYAPGVRAVDSRQYASDPCGALSATSSGEHSRVTPCYCLGTPAAGKSAGDNPFGISTPTPHCDAGKVSSRQSWTTPFGSMCSSTDFSNSMGDVSGAQYGVGWISGGSSQAAETPKTTLMIRNVPLMYTQELLMQEWPADGAYDFLYLPRTCTGQTNLSFAFINFISEANAMAFREMWQKRRLANFSSRKPLNISYADVQGLEANLAQIRVKRARRANVRQCVPVVVLGGREVEFDVALAAFGLDADDDEDASPAAAAFTPHGGIDFEFGLADTLPPFRPPPGL